MENLPIIPWNILNNICINHLEYIDELKLFLDIIY
jgi:hypothetical protein